MLFVLYRLASIELKGAFAMSVVNNRISPIGTTGFPKMIAVVAFIAFSVVVSVMFLAWFVPAIFSWLPGPVGH